MNPYQKPKKKADPDENMMLREAWEAAIETEHRYRELVEHANSAIIRIDTAFTVLFVNEYAQNFFGYSAEELLGNDLLETLLGPTHQYGSRQHDVARKAAESPELYGSYDQLNRCKDGRWVWVHWSVRAIRNARGDVSELMCVGIDITQRKDAEIKAERYRKRAQRLADLLIASEEKERALMAAYLHDNIVQILSLASIRMGRVIGELSTSDLTTVEERLSAVRNMLENAVSECRSVMDRLAPALLEELGLVAALQHLVEKQPLAAGVEIALDSRLEHAKLPHDLSSLLYRSIRELLMNALKYAGPCRIVITLQEDADTITGTVEDNGVGFDTAVLEDAHYDERGGFGLFAIRERLESLDGRLDIESAVGRGTVARITVPRRRKSPTAHPAF